jgi:hypothetical protein
MARIQQGPLAKLFSWLVLVGGLGGFLGVHYAAFFMDVRWRGSGGVGPKGILLIIDTLVVGLICLQVRFVRKHERAMRDAGFEPSEVAETYWETYLLRMKAQAAQRGGDVGERMTLDLLKRMSGLDAARTLAPADIRAAVRQAAPVSDAPAPVQLLGAWTSTPEANRHAGWTTQIELREAGGNSVARLWTWAPAGVRDEGESAASIREGFVEVKRESGGEVRVARITPGPAPDRVTLDEYRFPSGKPRNMQVNSCVLRRVRA